jgi:ABC-type glycerol-3-phosphate transport system substrate-binding protein
MKSSILSVGLLAFTFALAGCGGDNNNGTVIVHPNPNTTVITTNGTGGTTTVTTSGTTTVDPTTSLKWSIEPPPSVQANTSIHVQVECLDASGNVNNTELAVRIALGSNPSGATLNGTTLIQSVNGVADFTDLSVSAPGQGYTFVASVQKDGVAPVTSTPFNVTQGP